ncbi:cupin domain-containing protein [Pedobacter petrophilus]|uniref:Cupin domain-containing protein n=1 Tax=Pedobacter petrophilus TaxID=1908241 RepID=A0A7K0G383_9SPHI|nr:cupin domain-containing protein [Pedobacter petrophilus]MRX77860.1 cupin domain-containing protein [Pedobacter petrophilus]
MDLSAFLNSGLLELYLMGKLDQEEVLLVHQMRATHPEVVAELASLEAFFEREALQHAVKPDPKFDDKMESLFLNLEIEQAMQLSDTPLITSFSDADAWFEMISPLLPQGELGGRFEKLLRNDDQVMQALVITPEGVDEEVHENLHESFLILKGTCICTIGNETITMGPGSFMQIPLNQPHTIAVASKSVIAILQHVACTV